MKIGALYVRVSTHNQDELSPDAQIRLGKEFAEKNNITIPEEYIFIESVSGRKAEKRHDFQRMIGLAKTKPRPFSVIIVWKYSRFARNQEESIVYKSLLRRQCGIDVLSVSEPLVDGPLADFLTDELGLTSLGLVNHQHHHSMKKQALNLNDGYHTHNDQTSSQAMKRV